VLFKSCRRFDFRFGLVRVALVSVPEMVLCRSIERKMAGNILAKNDLLPDDFHIRPGLDKSFIFRMVGGQGLEPRTSCV
jgi:hypothetical protein